MIWENIKLALKDMKHSKLRSLLSLLGIVIGVASVVTILSLGSSVQKNITSSLESSGTNIINLSPTQDLASTGVFTDQYAIELEDTYPSIDRVAAINSSYANVRELHESTNVQIYGVPSYFSDMMSNTFSDGSSFSLTDDLTNRQVVFLGSEVAETLFPDGNAVGNYVSIYRTQAKSYQVVGILDEQDATFSISYDSSIFIPYNTYQLRFNNSSMTGTYVISVKEGEDTLALADELESYFDSTYGEDTYRLMSPATMVEMASEITGTLSSFLAAIAAISLLVGGIGIMNIMLVSVSERTREIGIRKAIGASPRVIRGQFIVEALAITLIGGLIGIALGSVVSIFVTNAMNWELKLSIYSFVLSIGFSMFVGVFFGWYPAKKASKLDPIEALNYE